MQCAHHLCGLSSLLQHLCEFYGLIHVVSIMWQIFTEWYGCPKTVSLLYGKIDMTRKRPIWVNQLLRDCFPLIEWPRIGQGSVSYDLSLVESQTEFRSCDTRKSKSIYLLFDFIKSSFLSNYTNLLWGSELKFEWVMSGLYSIKWRWRRHRSHLNLTWSFVQYFIFLIHLGSKGTPSRVQLYT